MKRVLVVALASCAGTAGDPPASSLGNHGPPPPPPAASTTCFQRFGHTPPDNPPFELRRELDPVERTIVERFNGSSSMRPELVFVDGDRFAAHDYTVNTEGHLVGAPWQWTSWTKTVTYTNGMSIHVTASITGDVLSEQTQIRHPNGQIEDHTSTYKRVECTALPSDSKGPLIDI